MNMVEINAKDVKILLLTTIENLIKRLQMEGIHSHIMKLNLDLR